MKIRKKHPILDRVKIIIFLLILLLCLGRLAFYIEEKSSKIKEATIEQLLETALQPVGSTMYIWGGGWDEEDEMAGATSTYMGLYQEWERFAKEQNETYDYNNYRFQREKGLDCSGYVGWVIYNTFETVSGGDGYVTTSTDMAKNYADRGWGTYIENPTEFFPGDVVSMDGHVWICLGTCADGSVVLVHSSPPGVSVCGTMLEDGTDSMAVKIATEYMLKYHPQWQEKYPKRSVPHEYLEKVSILRWNAMTMLDAKEWQVLSAEEIFLTYLYRK